MIRLLWIPVLGTVAALVAIALARTPRGPERPPEPPPFEMPEERDAEPEIPEEPEEPGSKEEAEEPPREFHLQLRSDGSLLDTESGETFASVEDLIERVGEARHTLFVANGKGVDEKALDEALGKLRDRFVVRKVYRAREAPPDD